MAEIEFKPCPFCGGEIYGPTSVQCNCGKKIITLGLFCEKCRTSFQLRATFTDDPLTEARNAWNRRADNG